MRLLALVALAVVNTACLTHLSPRTLTHLQIDWSRNYGEAQRHAVESGKPLLVVLAAGEIAGQC